MSRAARAAANYQEVDTSTWRPEHILSRDEELLPKIQPPILPGCMSGRDRIELTALAERVNPTYGGFARKVRAMDDLVAWVEAYRRRAA